METRGYPPVPPLDPAYVRDIDWAYEHYAALAKSYPNQWVAVVDGQVVSAGENLGNVEGEAFRIASPEKVAILFVERGMHVYGHSALGADEH